MSPPSHSELAEFVGAVAHRLGLRVDEKDHSRVASLLASRMQTTRSRTVSAYLELLSSRQEEEAALARDLSINETYFLRNRPQFAAFAALVAERARRGVRHLRVLSAACSSGEEPYSIAMVIREVIADVDDWTLSIVGFDLDPEVVHKARLGRYTTWSLRELDAERRQRYFRSSGGLHTIDESIRAMVRIEHRNLVRPDPGFWRAESFDVVFCRNALMYFDRSAAREAVARISAVLAPDGHLFLGHAETLRGISDDFELCHTHDTFYYRHRRTPGPAKSPRLESPSPSPPPPSHGGRRWLDEIAHSTRRIEELSRPGPAATSAAPPIADDRSFAGTLELIRQERFSDALATLAADRGLDTGDPDADLLQAVTLLQMGDIEAAGEVARRVLDADALSASAHYLIALCCERAGDIDAALEHDRNAIYLDSTFAMPHLHIGLLTRRRGHDDQARRALSLAESLLPHEDAARITMFGGGFDRQALVRICRGQLRSFGGDDG